MTRAELRNLSRKRLGETTAAFWSDAELNSWINLGCKDLAFRVKCLRDKTFINITVDTSDYVLSTFVPDALAVLEMYFLVNGDTWTRITPVTREELNITDPGWKSADSSVPTKYMWSREENLLTFYPAPNSDNAGTSYAEAYYVKDHSDLAADSDSPSIPDMIHPAIADYVVHLGFDQRGWLEKATDAWAKYLQKINDYQVERQREREDDEIISKNYRNVGDYGSS